VCDCDPSFGVTALRPDLAGPVSRVEWRWALFIVSARTSGERRIEAACRHYACEGDPLNEQTFDTLSRRADLGLSRRMSLVALGAAALIGLTPARADAGKAGKKARKKCKSQVAACATGIAQVCTGSPECANLIPCCDFLGTCDAGAFIQCIGQNSPQ
jgi:hypothetical protein